MIAFDNVWKLSRAKGNRGATLAGVNCVFEPGKGVAILCHRERDKDTLIGLLTGAEHPDSGRIVKRGRMSWLVGDMPSSKRSMTALESLNFIARVYGLNSRLLVQCVDEFAGIGHKKLTEPMNSLDKTTRTMIAYAAVLAVPFDWYLMTGEIRGNDPRSEMLRAALHNRLSHASAIIVSDEVGTALNYAKVGVVLRDGHFHVADSIQHAASVFLRG